VGTGGQLDEYWTKGTVSELLERTTTIENSL
jgi:hypothetical protein